MINTDINIKIDNSKNFFSFFQTPKNSRKPIKNIFFNLDFNLSNSKYQLNNFKIDNEKIAKETSDLINNFSLNKVKQTMNLIKFKNLVNEVFLAYDG